MNNNKKQNGFTLIELMIVILLASTMLAYGIPAYRDFGLRHKIINEGNSLLLDFSFARVTAIKEGRNVVVLSNSGANWLNGWRVFIDDGNLLYNAGGDVLLRQSQGRDQSLTYLGGTGLVVFNNLGGATNQDAIVIANTGVSKTVTVRIVASGMVTVR